MKDADHISATKKDLLSVKDISGYLGVGPVTVYRWCREGRLPCMKIGKYWRIRREAFEDFLRRGERQATLTGQLRSFLTIPDNVLGVAQNQELLHRLDAAFFRVAEARGGLLVKFCGGETSPEAKLRAALENNGLAVGSLESEGRFRFARDEDPVNGRVEALRRLITEVDGSGRTIWATFNWTKQVDLETVLRQQEVLVEIVEERNLVVKTAVVERVVDEWASTVTLRRAQVAHSGVIWLSENGLMLSRVRPLPPE